MINNRHKERKMGKLTKKKPNLMLVSPQLQWVRTTVFRSEIDRGAKSIPEHISHNLPMA